MKNSSGAVEGGVTNKYQEKEALGIGVMMKEISEVKI